MKLVASAFYVLVSMSRGVLVLANLADPAMVSAIMHR